MDLRRPLIFSFHKQIINTINHRMCCNFVNARLKLRRIENILSRAVSLLTAVNLTQDYMGCF